jgi:UDP-N-acetylmuramoyl-tripeptide--D-alanyl-D-alanine ligase
MTVTIPIERVVSATGGKLVRRGAATFSSVVIDSRAISPGCLFFAIPGERFDGHAFVAEALAKGAAGAVVNRGRAQPGEHTIVEVDDTIAALGKLAAAHRRAMTHLKVAAVTGSNGKTTTKEMLAAILGAGGEPVLRTEGNLNNHLGVPLTLLRLSESHRYAVIEMGMSALGEIAYLTRLSQPDVAVIVNIAAVHLETLGSIENVAKAKAEIFQGLSPGGVGITPIDQPLLETYAHALERHLTFGPEARKPSLGVDNIVASASGVECTLHVREGAPRQLALKMSLLGAHNAVDAAAAAAAALSLGATDHSFVSGLAAVRPAKHRSQLIEVAGRRIIDDCYNASPLSTRAAIDTLFSVGAERQRVAVLGDMLELGPDSERLHREIGEYAAGKISQLIAFGPRSRAMAEAAQSALGPERVFHSEDPSAAARRALEVSAPGDVILVKASRGMKLERVIDEMAEGPKA